MHEVMSRHLMAARDVSMPLAPQNPKSLLGVCASLRVLAMMEACSPSYKTPTLSTGSMCAAPFRG